MGNKEEIPAGTVIEFLQDQKIQTAMVVSSKNQRLLVLSENNREINISRNRLLGIVGPRINESMNRTEIVKVLQEISERRDNLSKDIDVEDLWNVLEGEEAEFTARELAEFIYNNPEPDEVAGVQRAVLQNKLFFQYKSGVFIPRSKENVEQKKIQAQREAEKERKLQIGSEWLKAVFSGTEHPSIPEEDKSDIISKIKDFALHGSNSTHYAFIKELFKRADINLDPQLAFKIIVRLGTWKEDENILIYQYDIPREFDKTAIEYAEKLAQEELKDPLDEKRIDLTGIRTITIDGEETRDIDDALSLEQLDDGIFRIGVHITDVSSHVQQDDPIDREARARMTSIYLPDEKIPMLPSILSEDICSLVAGKKRRAISFMFTVDEDANILKSEVFPSFIRVDERLTYEQANSLMQTQDNLKILYNLSERLQLKRKERGALIIHVPEIQAVVDSEGKIHLKRYRQDEPAQIIVSEWMIAANAYMASYFIENQIPAIFRCQGEAKDAEIPYTSEHSLFYLCHQRKQFARAELSIEPAKHCSLGLDCYVSVTSPIRRYIDLILQRQYRHFLLTGKPLYSSDELDGLITEMNSILPKALFVSRKWNRYWILKYIKQEKIKSCEALILDQNDRVINVILPEFMLETTILKRNIHNVPVGKMVTVRIEKINPREDILRLQL